MSADQRLNESDAVPSHLGCSPPLRLREESPWLQSGGPRNPWASLSAARFRVEGQLRWRPDGGQEPSSDEAASSVEIASGVFASLGRGFRHPSAPMPTTERLVLRSWRPSDRAPFATAQRRPRRRGVPQRRRALHARRRATSCSTPSRPTGRSAGSDCGAPPRARTPTSAWASSGWPCPRSCRRCCPRSRSAGGWRRPAWGRGLATEGARASLRHAFEELDLEAVISIIDPDNERSIRVAREARHAPRRRSRAPANPPPIARIRDFFAGCGFFTRARLDPLQSGSHTFGPDAEPSRRERGPGVARPAALKSRRSLGSRRGGEHPERLGTASPSLRHTWSSDSHWTSRRSPGTSSRSSTARARPAPTACSTRPTSAPPRFAERLRRPGRRARRRRASPPPWPSSRRSSELVGRAGSYAMLRFAVDTADPANGALLAARPGARHGDRDQAAVLRARVGRARRRARRGAARRRRPRDHAATTCARCAATARTSSPSPRRSSWPRRRVTGRDAWTRLFSELTSAIRVELPDDDEGVRARRRAQPPACRPTARCAARRPRRVTAALEPGAAHARATSSTRCCTTRRSTTACAPTRRWLASAQPRQRGQRRVGRRRCVEAVRAATTSRSAGIASRRELLGVDRLADYDRMAVGRPTRRSSVDWAEATTSCSTPSATSRPCSATSPSASSTSDWIDAPVRPHKRGGAFCAYTRPERPPLRDAQLHRAAGATCSRSPTSSATACTPASRSPRGVFEQHTPLTLAETASVFGETLVFRAAARRGRHARVAAGAAGREHRGLDRHRLPPDRDEPASRTLVHTARRERGRAERRALRRAVEAVAGRDARRRGRGHRRLPARGGPTSRTSSARPGYVYAYAYGQLLALSVYRALPRRGRELRARATSSCSAPAGRAVPEELAAIAGPRPRRPGLLGAGPRSRRDQLEQAEAAAAEVRAAG